MTKTDTAIDPRAASLLPGTIVRLSIAHGLTTPAEANVLRSVEQHDEWFAKIQARYWGHDMPLEAANTLFDKLAQYRTARAQGLKCGLC